jgi:hypothetical protein
MWELCCYDALPSKRVLAVVEVIIDVVMANLCNRDASCFVLGATMILMRWLGGREVHTLIERAA